MKNEKWFITAKRADFNALAGELGISPVLARLIRNRDIADADHMRMYLQGSLSDLPDPALLKDAGRGAEIMMDKIRTGKRIRIISDYDVDGVCSNYILYQGLKLCGGQVDYRIPDRVGDGYGINDRLVKEASDDGIDTIITCDNGIAAAAQVAYGNGLGLTFIITDHHDVPFEAVDGETRQILPPAAAVINPKQEDCPYPYDNICGAVVAWHFIQVLYERMGIDPGRAEDFLAITALATVCDVMPLVGENRILVKEGLKQMNQMMSPDSRLTATMTQAMSSDRRRPIQPLNSTAGDSEPGASDAGSVPAAGNRNPDGSSAGPVYIPGLQALIEANHLTKKITAYHLGFVIGPCINASGRLSTARLALSLLLEEDMERCRVIADQLVSLNADRKEMTRKGEEEALAWLESSGHGQDKVLVIYLPECHESIAGIIAGRIKEIYHRPVFVLTRTLQGVKGSGRSIDSYHMYQEMTRVADCFDKFGGHPMAAGLSMQEDRIEELRDRLNTNTTLTDEDFIEKVMIDIALPVSYLSFGLIEEFDRLEPFGIKNPKPLFAQKNMQISGLRELGNNGRVLKLYLKDPDGYPVESIWFGNVEEFYRDLEAAVGKEQINLLKKGRPNRIRLACTYYPEINEWNGRRSIQIVIKNYRISVITL